MKTSQNMDWETSPKSPNSNNCVSALLVCFQNMLCQTSVGGDSLSGTLNCLQVSLPST